MQNKQTAAIIKARCRQRNLPLTRLIAECGLSKSFIYDLEKRDVCPSVERLERIADVLDCSIDYLVGRTKEPAVNRPEPLGRSRKAQPVEDPYAELAAFGGHGRGEKEDVSELT